MQLVVSSGGDLRCVDAEAVDLRRWGTIALRCTFHFSTSPSLQVRHFIATSTSRFVAIFPAAPGPLRSGTRGHLGAARGGLPGHALRSH